MTKADLQAGAVPSPRDPDWEPEADDEGVDWHYPPELEPEIRRRAAFVHRRFRGVVPFDDLLQEARIWLATHPQTIARHLADPAKGTAYTGWAAQGFLEKLAMKEVLYVQRLGIVPLSKWKDEGAHDAEV